MLRCHQVKLIDRLIELPDDHCILALRPWSSLSAMIMVPFADDLRVPADFISVTLE
jgi:hypothetical protein